jgi:Secretion system C-terminal sorting domain
MKKKAPFLFLIFAAIAINTNNATAQCTWKTILTDGYEYSTIVPDIIPGTTIHNTPQSFAVRTGAKSLYMNFTNGLPTGSLVYERPITVCPNVPIRITSWITTSFSGVQCDMQLQIVDSNNVALDNTASLLAPYSPAWAQYQSAIITSTTPIVYFRMFTNVGGSAGGNDLSMDDFMVENCSNLSLGSDTTLCNTQSVILNAGSGFSSYLWSNGDTTQTIIASTSLPGSSIYNYSVTAAFANGCNFSDTIRITFINCTGITDLLNENSFSISPNPATDFVTLKSVQKIISVSLLNAIGEKVKEFSYAERLFIGDVPKGYYLLKIKTKSLQFYYRKILIE